MRCTRCGKEVRDGAAFCIYCGNKLGAPENDFNKIRKTAQEGNTTGGKGISETALKRAIPIAVILVIAVIGAVVGVKMYNSPAAQMNRAIKSGDLELAYEIFDDNFYAEDLSEKSIELLKAAVTQVQESYLAGTTAYEEANEALRYIRWFDSDEVSDTLSEASDIIETRYQVASQIEAADTYYQNGEYYQAITAYENALSLDPSDTDAASGLEKAESAYRDAVLTEAESYAAQGDFDSAMDVISAAAERCLGDDADLAAALDALRDRKIGWMADNVYTAADGGDWDGALELLDAYQAEYPDDQKLENARADILKRMPITLGNLTMISLHKVTVHTDEVKDRWGTSYDSAVVYDASQEAFALYNLNKGYTSFSGTVFVPNEASNGKNMSIAVYLDENLVYYKDGITEETAPISFKIDTAGATTMRIVTDNTGSYSCGWLYFTNTNFAKVET